MKTKIIVLLVFLAFLFTLDAKAITLSERLEGKILIQVQQRGEAWYVYNGMRNYMPNGDSAYTLMRFLSLGITDSDLLKISSVPNTNAMKSAPSHCTSNALALRLKGKILLQVQQQGQAWYVDTEKCIRIYMRDGATAYQIMRFLSLGISDADLFRIPSATQQPTPKETQNTPVNNTSSQKQNAKLDYRTDRLSSNGSGDIRRKNVEFPTSLERQNVPDCEGLAFTHDPVDLRLVREISPMGNLGPPGHTFPTDHTFLHMGEHGDNKSHNLYAPADVYVTNISQNFGITQDPEDDTIWFALCKDVYGYFNHVKELSSAMQAIVDRSGCAGKPHTGQNSCLITVLEKVDAGTLLGVVGRRQGNFDIGMVDLRKKLGFINPERHATRSNYIQCPYDYFENKQKFYDLINRTDGTCGVTMQDLLGTLQGNWFLDNTSDSIAEWNNYLAFVYDNENFEVGVVSIGGVIGNSGKLEFVPQNSGKTNRTFKQVTPDEQTYCYSSSTYDGKILVQLVSNTELKIEKQNGTCTNNENFTNKKKFYIR